MSQKRVNIAISTALVSLVLAVINTSLLIYAYGQISSDDVKETGNSEQLANDSATFEISTPVAGPSFEELNITPPPPTTDQFAYDQWVESYGAAYRDYLETEEPQQINVSQFSDVGMPRNLEEENWLENELQVRQVNLSAMSIDEINQLSQKLLEEYRAE